MINHLQETVTQPHNRRVSWPTGYGKFVSIVEKRNMPAQAAADSLSELVHGRGLQPAFGASVPATCQSGTLRDGPWRRACRTNLRMTGRLYLRLAPLALVATLAGCSGSPDGDGMASPTGPSSGSGNAACAAQVTGLPSSIATDGGRFTFTITTGAGCAWSAQTNTTWADVAPGSGQGTATPVLTAAANTRTDARTLTITVNGQSFQVAQNAMPTAPVPVCSYLVDPTSLEEGPDAGTAEVTVTTLPGCAWTATASEGWITMLTSSGTGSARIKIEVTANTGDVRHAFLTVAGRRVDVRQRARQP
jgi:hypothetical protein